MSTKNEARRAANRAKKDPEPLPAMRPVPELTYLPASDYPAVDENAPPKPWKDPAAGEGEGGEP